MKNKQTNRAEQRKGVFLLCLPVLIVPILFLLGMKGGEAQVPDEVPKGFNQEMPKVLIKDQKTSKSDAYRMEEKLREEPTDLEIPAFFQKPLVESKNMDEDLGLDQMVLPSSDNPAPSFAFASKKSSVELADPEQAMMEQLKELEKLLQQEHELALKQNPEPVELNGELSKDLLKEKMEWERMMDQLEGSSASDPEMDQLEGLLDKLLLLQQGVEESGENPAIAELNGMSPSSISKENEEGREGNWDKMPDGLNPGLITGIQESQPNNGIFSNGFFGLEESVGEGQVSDSFRSTIKAHVAESQEIFPGEAVELILDQKLNLGDIHIPEGTVIHANTSLSGARLQLSVSGLVWKDSLIPVSLKAYGLDGLPGVEIADQKASSQWLDESARGAQGIRINPMGMDWQSQLASSGVEASRSLIRSKSRLKKLKIKGGHPLLLIDFSNSKTH
ncbi:conjugative transposon protein TraM [uncultured Algoriphagus sp.]|uniref:conjugative transposon protein TraM n=1 Tax=uncultured Algoriphagus sp. TaxID=417365 RepID=UPI0025920B70|nr:conjugative transposon protein TraM [uncultured Algoriphagus sp.]